MSQGYSVPFPPRLFDADGAPANAWRITTYVAGTVTPLTTYSNATLTSANTNPIVTDASGYFKCFVAAGVLIKASVTNAAGVPQTAPSFDNELPMIDVTSGGASVTAVPAGGIVAFGGTSAPTGFLLCNGALVSRATFSALFTAIGTNYGAGDGSTTFAVPDCRGRFLMGVASSGTGNAIAASFGAIDHTHTGPSHTHSVVVTRDGWGSALNTPSTTGRLNVGDAAGAGQFSSSYQPSADLTVTSAAGGTAVTGTANPPGLTVSWIIKT